MAEAIQSDLVVVANRLPVHRANPQSPWETSPGGLVSALMPILREHSGIWVGWAGTAEQDPKQFSLQCLELRSW